MKKKLVAICMSATLSTTALVPSTAHAQGIPTIDIAHILTQVIAWAKDYSEAMVRYQQLRDQYQAMTGYRGFGALLGALGENDFVDAAWMQQLKSIETAHDFLVANRDMMDRGMESTTRRLQRIKSLQDAIASTDDQKSTLELQARIQAEQAGVNADANRLAVLLEQSKVQAARMDDDIRTALKDNVRANGFTRFNVR